MKWIILRSVFIVVSLLAPIIPAYADELGVNETDEQQNQQKDECLLAARKCGNSATSIQDKIERLKEEIAKGRAVYTPEELSRLKQKLDEVNKTLDFLLEK